VKICLLPAHTAVKKLTYFALKAAIFPAVCCMEVGGAEDEGEPVSMGPFTNDLCKVTWDSLKPSTPNGQLPLCTLEDGTVIPESSAIMRACAAQTKMLGDGKDYVLSEMLMGMTGDLVKDTYGSDKVPSAFTLDSFKSAEAVKEFNDETKPKAIERVGKYEKYLTGDKFTTSGITVSSVMCILKPPCPIFLGSQQRGATYRRCRAPTG